MTLGCTHKTTSGDNAPAAGLQLVKAEQTKLGGSPVKMIPKATAFRMTGDYADHVAVTLGADGQLTYFPAPSDISERSKPLDLGGGWWLNRQGFGENSVFTKYTFEEYSRLEHTPSPSEIMESVIPGAKVSEMTVLPYPVNQAAEHIPEIKEILGIRD